MSTDELLKLATANLEWCTEIATAEEYASEAHIMATVSQAAASIVIARLLQDIAASLEDIRISKQRETG